MGKRLILGTQPEVDPLQELSESKGTITVGTEIRWDNREVGRPLAKILFGTLIAIVVGLYFPVTVTIFACIILLTQYLSPKLRDTKEMNSLLQDSWIQVPEGDISCLVESENVELRGAGGTRYSIGMDLGKASPNLLGSVGSLVRALDTATGFGL